MSCLSKSLLVLGRQFFCLVCPQLACPRPTILYLCPASPQLTSPRKTLYSSRLTISVLFLADSSFVLTILSWRVLLIISWFVLERQYLCPTCPQLACPRLLVSSLSSAGLSSATSVLLFQLAWTRLLISCLSSSASVLLVLTWLGLG